MKRLGLDMALFRILLIAVPFGCGQKTFYEAAPGARCSDRRFIAAGTMGDAGFAQDGGLSQDGGAIPDGGIPDGGSQGAFLDSADCAKICGDTLTCQQTVSEEGVAGITCFSQCGYAVGCGRRPAELIPCEDHGSNVLARYFEQAAYLESASVHAFHRLARELAAHRAPQALVAAAITAATQEVRHARVMSRLAKRFGGSAPVPPQGPKHIRSLLEIAIENVQEGCVRETYGALVAWLQAGTASDAKVRRALRIIAQQETEHSRLAFAVAEFCQNRLAPDEQQQVRRAKLHAIAELVHSVQNATPAVLVDIAGLPPPELAGRFVAEAQRLLWTELT